MVFMNVSRSPLRLFVSAFAIVIVPWLAIQLAFATSPVDQQTAPRSGVPNKRVVVNFADLARRQAEQPDTNRVARSIHAPLPKSRPWTNTLSAPIRKAGPQPSGPAGPAPQPAASGSAPPELGSSFPAIIDDQRFIPPDTMGAVGPAHVMTTLNSEVAVQTRQGEVLSKVKLEDFWKILGHAEAFDPKLLYDHFHQRWLFVTLADGESTASALMIGVSKTSDPMGEWTLFDVDADAGNTQWADYPNVGFNEQRVIVTVNMV